MTGRDIYLPGKVNGICTEGVNAINILIYGDNSAAGLNLIPGFNSLGCSVDYVSNFDPKRGYFVSIPIKSGKTKNVRRISGFVNTLLLQFRLKKRYDLIIMANPFIAPFVLNNWVFRMLRERTDNLFWWITTCDTKMTLWSKVNNKPLCQICNKERGTIDQCPKFTSKGLEVERRVAECVDEIIPCGYEYASGHSSEKGNLKIIPLSSSITKGQHTNVAARDASKIKFYHGGDSIWKGSDVINHAFSSRAKKWDTKADFDYGKYLKLDEYIPFISNQDVVVDQLYNKSFGVNSIIIMQMGGLLLAGDTEKYEAFSGQPPAPYVRLSGEYDDLIEKIDDVVLNWKYYSEIRAEGPRYVEKHFSPVVIAQKFIERMKR